MDARVILHALLKAENALIRFRDGIVQDPGDPDAAAAAVKAAIETFPEDDIDAALLDLGDGLV